MSTDDLLTKREAADRLGISERTLQRIIDNGDLSVVVIPPFTGTRGWIFLRRDDVEAYASQHHTIRPHRRHRR
jgi:excisionase family DNA binding protein